MNFLHHININNRRTNVQDFHHDCIQKHMSPNHSFHYRICSSVEWIEGQNKILQKHSNGTNWFKFHEECRLNYYSLLESLFSTFFIIEIIKSFLRYEVLLCYIFRKENIEYESYCQDCDGSIIFFYFCFFLYIKFWFRSTNFDLDPQILI